MSEYVIVNFDSIKKDFPRLRKLALRNSLEFGGARKKVDLDVIPHSLHELYVKGVHVWNAADPQPNSKHEIRNSNVQNMQPTISVIGVSDFEIVSNFVFSTL